MQSADIIEAPMAFSRREDMTLDERGDGLLRAPTFESLEEFQPERFEVADCEVRDLAGAHRIEPTLHEHGFSQADLSGFDDLQNAFARARVAGRIEPSDIQAIRRAVVGRSIPLGGGARIRLFYVAPEGFIMRRAGPNGLALGDGRADLEVNDHEAALNVHVDQDVHGTPVRQILRGLCPFLFHHEAPTSRNSWSPLFLVNIWVPLWQITRPLTLADGNTLDRRAQQVRMALPTQELFARGEDRRFNDIWSFLHHPDQRWYFNSRMDSSRAYVFETLSTPHGACILPGEALAEELFLTLGVAMGAVEAGNTEAVRGACGRSFGSPPTTTAPLRDAIEEMRRVVDEGHREANAIVSEERGRDRWMAEARAARDAVTRMSIEMRAVGWVTRPRRGPLLRG